MIRQHGTTSKPVPTLVAHRGDVRRYPENTLESVQAALTSGACYVEIDIQLSADGVPVVIHDSDLMRTAGRHGTVQAMTLEELIAVEVNESARLGGEFEGIRIPTLSAMAALIRQWPSRGAFVEVKRASLEHFTCEWVMNRVLEQITESSGQFIVISFDIEAVRYAQEQGIHETAWIVDAWTESSHRIADELAPEYLFCNYAKIPEPRRLWEGSWRWVLYDIVEAELASTLGAEGAAFIETMAISELLSHPELGKGKCFDR